MSIPTWQERGGNPLYARDAEIQDLRFRVAELESQLLSSSMVINALMSEMTKLRNDNIDKSIYITGYKLMLEKRKADTGRREAETGQRTTESGRRLHSKPCAAMPRCSVEESHLCKCGALCTEMVDVYLAKGG